MAQSTCSVETCNDLAAVRGWCRNHYKHWHRYGDPLPQNRRPGGVGKPGGTCSIEGCEEPFYCRTWCVNHYGRWQRNGDPLAGNRSPNKNNAVQTHRDAPPGHRRCLHCDTVKPFSEFRKDRTLPGGIAFYCKDCVRDYIDSRRARDPEAYLAQVRRRTYKYILKRHGMSLADYDAMLNEQDALCRICRRPETGFGAGGHVKPLSLDHDHRTGKVRGLLCSPCNKGLGAFEDDIARLTAAIDYLIAASDPP